jgi:hypothetical protein
MREVVERKPSAIPEAAAGGAIGALVGTIVGLSASPVVGTVLGAISAALLALLGLSSNSAERGAGRHPNSVRITAFGFSCVLGIVLGVLTRTHDWLSPTPAARIQTLVAAGYSVKNARDAVFLSQYGFVPSGQPIDANARRPSTSDSVLFADAGTDYCSSLAQARFSNIRERLQAFDQRGGKFSRLATQVKTLPPESWQTQLNAAFEFACNQD